jgi:hypothetical protein
MRILKLATLLLWLLLPAACRPAGEPASPTAGEVASPTAGEVEIAVYFTDTNRYAAATEPYEVAVTRTAPAGAGLPAAVLAAFFEGPTAGEAAQGLEAITSGATGFRELRIDDAGVAHVTLEGPCSSGGATYTIAQPLMKNLLQFEEIDYVKIYDEAGQTGTPAGASNSIPFCLEP